jgi:hypothetical protein
MGDRDLTALDVEQLCSIFDNLAGDSDFKTDVVAELLRRFLAEHPFGFSPCPNIVVEMPEEQTREFLKWQEVYKRVGEQYMQHAHDNLMKAGRRRRRP